MPVAPSEHVSSDPPRAETIEEIFLALESPLMSYALRLLGDRAVSEDVVQEAFMKLNQQFRDVREPRRWLYRTVHNLALNHRRQSAKVTSLDASSEESHTPTTPLVDPQPLPDELIARCEGIGLVRLSLANLDERSQTLLRLKFNEELSYQQISERTGLTVSNVGYILHHALKTIGTELAKSGVVP